MLGRQRITVHRDRDQRLPVRVVQPGGREACRPAIERVADELAGTRLHAGAVEQLAKPDALPQRVADQVAANLVADAGDGHVLLVHLHRQQLGVGEREGVVNHPVDVQRPAGRVDAWREELGVDPVEVAIRNDDWRDAVDVELCSSGERGNRVYGRWDASGGWCRVRAAVEEDAADSPAGDRKRRDPERGADEAAPTPGRHLRSLPRWRRELEQPADHVVRHHHAQDGRHERQQAVDQRVAQRGEQAEDRDSREASRRPGSVIAGQDPENRREHERAEDDDHVEGQLVGGAEQVHHDLLRARRLQRDQERADLEHDRRSAGDQTRQQLGGRQRDASGHDPRKRGGATRRDGCGGGGCHASVMCTTLRARPH